MENGVTAKSPENVVRAKSAENEARAKWSTFYVLAPFSACPEKFLLQEENLLVPDNWTANTCTNNCYIPDSD